MWLCVKPTIEPAMSHPPWIPARRNLFTCMNSPGGVSSWISAVTVGQNIQNPAATRVLIRYSCQTWTRWSSAKTATITMMIARIASRNMTRKRRSLRSMITPVNGNISMAGRVCNTASAPSAISDCVVRRINHATAVEFIPLPNMETTFARNANRSGPRSRVVVILLSIRG